MQVLPYISYADICRPNECGFEPFLSEIGSETVPYFGLGTTRMLFSHSKEKGAELSCNIISLFQAFSGVSPRFYPAPLLAKFFASAPLSECLEQAKISFHIP